MTTAIWTTHFVLELVRVPVARECHVVEALEADAHRLAQPAEKHLLLVLLGLW